MAQTRRGIKNSFDVLAETSSNWSDTTEKDDVLSIAVEEAMRLYGSVMYRFRRANEACELGGQQITKGDLLILLHSAANRDPTKFSCPDSADLTRKPENDHLAFNKGLRKCVGSGFARAEIIEALRAVLTIMPNLRLDADAETPKFDGLFIRSWRPLNVVFDT